MLTHNKTAQDMARAAIEEVKSFIKPGVTTEAEIRQHVESYLYDHGSQPFWYHGVGCLVHVGHSRSLTSQSGRQYEAGGNVVGQNDIITLDLSPTVEGDWGDFARTLFVVNGVVTEDDPAEEKYAFAMKCEKILHGFVMDVARPDMSFATLHSLVNQQMEELGAQNLDYSGNFGHSINVDQADRIYILPDNDQALGSCRAFTFEPHLKCLGCDFGVKRENIYYFGDDGKLKEL